MLKVPKTFLNESFTYEPYEGIDEYHAPSFGEAVEINHCRTERKHRYSRSAIEEREDVDIKLFCFKQHTEPFLPFKERSRITVDGDIYIIKDVMLFDEVYASDLTYAEIGAIQYAEP